MYYRLIWYPIFYKERIYNYLLTDKYYYTCPLSQILKGYAQIISMKNVKNSHEITDHDKEVIKEEERLFGEEDIRRMFNLFERNNFRENPICEYVLGWKIKTKQQKEKLLSFIFEWNENIKRSQSWFTKTKLYI